jgi:ADP-dependent NAD(P)H-hydrate dehydratase / NAD(P)H-hydrate epimerase
MIRMINIAQMRQWELEAAAQGVSSDVLMNNAGAAVAREAERMLAGMAGSKIVVLCGSGNNGGDGLVAAARLAERGMHVTVFLVKGRSLEEPRVQQAIAAGAKAQQIQRTLPDQALSTELNNSHLLLDALLGTGTKLPLRPEIISLLNAVRDGLVRRQDHLPVLAVDCPSGVDCDSGNAPDQVLAADRTVTFGAMKYGLARFPAAALTGEVIVADIGLADNLATWQGVQDYWAAEEWIGQLLPDRPRDSHKGTYGRVIAAGGSINYPGAPLLAAKGAYRSGAGLVTLAVPGSVSAALVAALPEATWIVLPEEAGVIASGAEDILLPEVYNAQALVLGPGIGKEKTTLAFLKNFLREAIGQKARIGFTHASVEKEKAGGDRRPPMVVDADALRMLATMDSWWSYLPKGSVLTPHPGEMAALTGKTKEEIQANRIEVARAYAREWQIVLVLKGAFTVVANPDGRAAVEPFANSALAHAGTGDVLAGIIGGLLAQGMSAWEAAVLGAYLHGSAGALAALAVGDEAGVLAGEVAALIPESMRALRK